MQVKVFNEKAELQGTLMKVQRIAACRDGRHIVTSVEKCECCNHEAKSSMQVPANYTIEIKTEIGDEIVIG